MNLRQIEAFQAVIEFGSVTKAGDALSISQPAVSKLIAALQDSVGFKLFDRVGGRLKPTAKALMLFDAVDRMFSGMEKIRAAAEEIRADRRGRLSVGAPPALSHGFIQRVAGEVIAPPCDIIFSLQVRTSPRILQALSARQLDLGIAINLSEYPGVSSSLLARVRAVCVLSPKHPLAAKEVITAPDLHGERFVQLAQLDNSRQRIQSAFDDLRVRPNANIETPLGASACAFVAAGLGISIVDPILTSVFAPNQIVVRAFEPAVYFDFFLCEPAEVPRGQLADRFATAVRSAFDRIGGDN